MYYLLKSLLALSIVLPVLATVTVGLRFYSRRIRKQALLADDWLIVIALVATIITCALNFYGVFELGLGNPPPSLTQEQATSSYKVLYGTIILDYFTFGIIKISVIFFYKRLFSVGNFAMWANCLLITVGAWTIAGILAQAFAATPVSNAFIGVFSINWGALNVTMAVLDLLFDALVLCLPLIAIRELQVSLKQKISIIGLFWLGLICVISSAVRIYFNYEWSQLGPTSDNAWFQYVVSNTNLWLVVEGNVSIVAACMPSLGGLLRMQAPKLKSHIAFSRRQKGSGPSDASYSRPVRSAVRDPHRSLINDQKSSTWIKLDRQDGSSDRSFPHETHSNGFHVDTSFSAGYPAVERV